MHVCVIFSYYILTGCEEPPPLENASIENVKLETGMKADIV